MCGKDILLCKALVSVSVFFSFFCNTLTCVKSANADQYASTLTLMLKKKKQPSNNGESLHDGFRAILGGNVTLMCKALESASAFFRFYKVSQIGIFKTRSAFPSNLRVGDFIENIIISYKKATKKNVSHKSGPSS